MRYKEYFSRHFRQEVLVVVGHPIDVHRTFEKFSFSCIQQFHFIMSKIYKVKFQNS